MKRLIAGVVLLGFVFLPICSVAQEDKPKPAAISDAELEQMTNNISKEVSKLRGLEFKQPIRKGIKTRKELRDMVIHLLHEEMPKKRMQAYEKTLIRFGLLPEGTDLEKVFVDFYTENIAGLYDDKSKHLFLIRDTHRGLQAIALSHELVHTLQDEHFNLAGLPMKDKTDDDLAMAAAAIVEGDATEVMYRYAQEQILKDPRQFAELSEAGGAMEKEMESLRKAPLYLKRNLIFPYGNGLTFVNHLKGLGGGQRLNEAFRSPPSSTEQVLHPEKFTGERDEPTFLRLPDLRPALGPGWEHVLSNVMGELNVQVICEQFGLAAVAAIAAAGWDGDQYSVYERPGTAQIFIAWISTWDSEEDATDFFDVYRTILQRKYPGATLVESDVRTLWTWHTPKNDYVTIQRKGRDVLVLDGYPAGKSPALSAAAWRCERSSKPFKEAEPTAAPLPPQAQPIAPEEPPPKIPKELVQKEMDKVYDDVGKKFGMKGQDLKAMTEQFAASQPSTGKIVGNKFIDKVKGFEISHPPGWSFATDMPMPMLSIAIMDARREANVAIVTFPFGMEPIEMWMPMLEGMFALQFQEFKKIRSGRIVVNTVPGYELLFTGTKDGMTAKIRQVIFATPAQTYVLMCAAPGAVFEAKSAGFDEIINSFKTLAPAPQPAAPARKPKRAE